MFCVLGAKDGNTKSNGMLQRLQHLFEHGSIAQIATRLKRD
jgi:hypothetical protein